MPDGGRGPRGGRLIIGAARRSFHCGPAASSPSPEDADALWARLVLAVPDRGGVAFPPEIMALDGRQVTLRGHMLPAFAGREHARFLFSPDPPGCAHCSGTGIGGMVRVRAAEWVRTQDVAITLAGRLVLVPDAEGCPCELHDARRIA